MAEHAGVLRLVREARIRDLLPGEPPHRLEASGIVAAGGRYLVIFDNLRSVAVIDRDLDRIAGNTLVATGREDPQAYEDVAVDPDTGQLYLLIEAARRDGAWMGRAEEYDLRLRPVSACWLDFPLPGPDKGMEGLAFVRRAGTTYLLGLCEGNRDRDGAAGRRPGGGRIAVFRRGQRNWKHHATVDLPDTLWFTDFAALAVAGDRLAVVSQESSALWLGELAPRAWQVTGGGATYLFPRHADGGLAYCTVEGVSWDGGDEVVVVSDRAKPGMPGRCRATDQSLHVFTLAAARA